MRHTHFLPAVALLLVMSTPGASFAQTTAPYREGSVWEMTFVRVKPGRGDDYLNNLRANWVREMEEGKRQGIVTSYKVISSDAANASDWNLLLMAEFKNMAAMDQVDEKFRAIDAKLLGGESQQLAQTTKRSEIREILGDKLGRELVLRDSTVTASNRP